MVYLQSFFSQCYIIHVGGCILEELLVTQAPDWQCLLRGQILDGRVNFGRAGHLEGISTTRRACYRVNSIFNHMTESNILMDVVW